MHVDLQRASQEFRFETQQASSDPPTVWTSPREEVWIADHATSPSLNMPINHVGAIPIWERIPVEFWDSCMCLRGLMGRSCALTELLPV